MYELGAKDYIFSIVLMIPIFLSPFLYLVMRVLMDVQMYVPTFGLYHLCQSRYRFIKRQRQFVAIEPKTSHHVKQLEYIWNIQFVLLQ